MKLIHEVRNIVISYDGRNNWLYANWRGKQSEDDIRSGGSKMVEAMRDAKKSHQCTCVLNDNREVTGLWGHSVEWAANEWLPAMLEAGLHHFAWVLSPKALVNLPGVRLRSRAGRTDVMKACSDIEEAKQWLKAVRQ